MAGRRGREVYRDTRWRIVRDRVMFARAQSLCEVCREVPATAVHHIKRLADGGAPFDPANLQALCYWCHKRRHDDDKRGDSPELQRQRRAWREHVRELFS